MRREGRPLTANARAFDEWIRTRFVELNTQLEELYFAQPDRASVEGIGEPLKEELVREGRECILRLLDEGNTDEGFERAYEVLGDVGLYMAACRRHEITEPSRERRSPLTEASALAMQLGASLGVAPRIATSHLETHNRAIDGDYKRFTALPDERVFTDYNTRALFAFKRAADALVRILPLGISHPVARDLLLTAEDALHEVRRLYGELARELNTDRFFYCVRPYFKPYRVGLHEYRGMNAGDFAGINEIDLLLGLCQANEPSYSQLLVDKFLFMRPDDQARLRDCMRQQSLLDRLLEQVDSSGSKPWFKQAAAAFLAVCDAHGAAAAQHHDGLVRTFIELPSRALPEEMMTDITASGPPLAVVLRALEKLRDLRMAADRDDIPTRHRDLERLRATLGSA